MKDIKQRLEEQIKKTKTPIWVRSSYQFVMLDIHSVSELETILKYDIKTTKLFTDNITLFCSDDPMDIIFTCFTQDDEYLKTLYTTTIDNDTLEKLLETILQYLETRKDFSKCVSEDAIKDDIARIELSIEGLLYDKASLTKRLYDLQGKTILDEDTNRRLKNAANMRATVLEEIKDKLLSD